MKSTHIPDDWTTLPGTAAEARALGLRYYFTGQPCRPRGHIAPRQTANRDCHLCTLERSERYLESKSPGRTAAVAEKRRLAAERREAGEEVARRRPLVQRDREARAEAIASGKRHYHSCRPCQKGHEAPRRAVANGQCLECRIERKTQYRQDAWEEMGTEAYYQEKALVESRYPSKSPEARRASDKARRLRRATGPQLHALRTPPWANRSELQRFYDERPDGMTVDHIVPLNGHPLLTGLHVPGNLQYLTKRANNIKGNRLAVTESEARRLVEQGLAVWSRDVREDNSIDWSLY